MSQSKPVGDRFGPHIGGGADRMASGDLQGACCKRGSCKPLAKKKKQKNDCSVLFLFFNVEGTRGPARAVKPAITKARGPATKVRCVKVAEALKHASEVRNRGLTLGHPCFLLY